MTEIFLIRHTQAEGNLYRMMQGHWDGDVTAMGWRQIEALAERFKNIHIDAVYSSDLYRTRMTATAAARHRNLEIRCDRRFREIDLGSWETGFFGNLAYEQPEQMAAFVKKPSQWKIEGAETYEQVRSRAFPALLEVAEKHDGETIVVVSHGVTIRCLMSAILDLDINEVDRLPIHGNTAVSHIFYEKGKFTVDYDNDQSHLEIMGIPQWHASSSLRHEAIDPVAEREYYTDCYRQAWIAAHGSELGFSAGAYLEHAACHYLVDKDSVLRFYDGETPVGVLDMDVLRGRDEGIGWISLLCLCPEYRCKGYGVQLLARAIKKYANMGRDCLRLNVAEENAAARAFYKKWGFEEIGEEKGNLGTLLLLERKLGGKKYV